MISSAYSFFVFLCVFENLLNILFLLNYAYVRMVSEKLIEVKLILLLKIFNDEESYMNSILDI